MPEREGGFVPSEFDREHVGQILLGRGDWFGADLLRLIAHADSDNRERLRRVFPEHVALYEQWLETSGR